MMGRYIPRSRYVQSERWCIRKAEEHTGRMNRVLGTSSFAVATESMDIFGSVTEPCERSRLLVVKVLLLPRIYVEEDTGSWERALLNYIEITGPIDPVDETLRCTSLRWSLVVETDYSLGRSTDSSENRHLFIVELLNSKSLLELQTSLQILTAHHKVKVARDRMLIFLTVLSEQVLQIVSLLLE